MTHEQRFQALSALAMEDKLLADAPDLLKDPSRYFHAPDPRMRLLANLLQDALEGMVKGAGKQGTLLAVKRLLASSPADWNKMIEVTVWGSVKRFVVINNSAMLLLKDDIPALPHYTDEETKGKAEKLVTNLMPLFFNPDPVTLPGVLDLKRDIAINGYKRNAKTQRRPIDIGGVYVDAFLLLDIMQALPDCTADSDMTQRGGFATSVRKDRAPIRFTAEAGEALLMPINIHAYNKVMNKEG